MKTYLWTIAFLLTWNLAYAQTANSVIEKFKNHPRAECVSISPFMMSIGKLFSKGEDAKIISHIKSMKVLELDDCSANVRKEFSQSVDNLHSNGYETFVQVNDSGEKVRILAKKQGKYIKELLIVCIDKESCTMVKMDGKISQQDIDKLVAQNTSKKHGRR